MIHVVMYRWCMMFISYMHFMIFILCRLVQKYWKEHGQVFYTYLSLEWKGVTLFMLYQTLTRVIDKFVSFFHRAIIYGWIYIIFCHYQQWSVVNQKKTLKCKVRQTCDVSMTLMTSHVGDVVVKTPEDRCGRFSLSGYKCYSTSAIFVKFSDNICT